VKKSEKEKESEKLRVAEKREIAEMERLDREKAAEMEKMRLEIEHELKLRQLQTSRVGSDDGEEVVEGEAGKDGEGPLRVRAPNWGETLAGRTKRFGDTVVTTCCAEDENRCRPNSSVFRECRTQCLGGS